MRLNNRDRAILADLERFRCLSRDDIAAIHFANVKEPGKAANATMLRLFRLGLVERSAHFQPYVYLQAGSTMKCNSQKIPHFLEIAGVYRDLLDYETPSLFTVEPKYGRKSEAAEPDAFTIFKRSPIFIEVQRNQYSAKVMEEKVARYESLFQSGLLGGESWGPQGRKVFPAVLILTANRYAVSSPNFAIIQAASISDFMRAVQAKESPRVPVKVSGNEGIKIRIS